MEKVYNLDVDGLTVNFPKIRILGWCEMVRKTKRNIYLIYTYIFLSTFILFYSCDTLFYLERGVSSSGYVFFITIIFLMHILLEVPSGIIADKYSRKNILLLSNFLFVLSTIIFILSKNYYLFVLGTVIKGLENSIVTGVANSILFDEVENKKDFSKILFRKNFFYNLSYMLAMILGGYIGQKYGLVVTYYLTLIPFFINFFIIFLIEDKPKNSLNNTYLKKEILNNAIYEIKNNKLITNLIFTNSIVFSVIRLVEESHPEYSFNIGISVWQIGIYTSMILIVCICGSYIGSKLDTKYYKFVLYGNSFMVGLCILLIGLLNNKYGILFLLTIYIFCESFENIMLSTIHNNISSKSRITVESIFSMALSLLGIFLSVIMSVLLNFMQVFQLYVLLGLLLIVYSIINIAFNYKNMKSS